MTRLVFVAMALLSLAAVSGCEHSDEAAPNQSPAASNLNPEKGAKLDPTTAEEKLTE